MRYIKDIQNEIIRLKKEKDVCILAHSYQTADVLEVADFVGDSFALSKYAAKSEKKNILMCGVRFMAETAKILSPEKCVILSNPEAGCPMAEQLSCEELKKLKSENEGYAVVAYINTTAELKCECDVCVTSSSALDIIKKLPQKNILFIPDCNLGGWIEKQVPEKNFRFVNGGCPVHMKITEQDVISAKNRHKNALLLVHPECIREVTDKADFAGSTAEIIKYVQNSKASEFIIGTDNSITNKLQLEYPNKRFFPLSKNCICSDMRLTTVVDVYNVLCGTGGEEIVLSTEVIEKARQSIEKMLAL